jgi:hypothetical protein
VTKTATAMIMFLRAHKRLTVIIVAWVLFCAFSIIPNWHEGPEPLYFLVFSTGFITLISSQLFWIGCVLGGRGFIPGKPRRVWFVVIVSVVYALFLAHNFGLWDSALGGDSTHLTTRRLLIDGAWSVWVVGSWVGFGLVAIFWTLDRMTHALRRGYVRARNASAGYAVCSMNGAIDRDPPSPARRRFSSRLRSL